MNPILLADSYKYSHYQQYPEGTKGVYAYIEPRKASVFSDFVVVFGIQAYIRDVLNVQITEAHVDEAEALITAHGFTFNREGWMRIVDVHNGYLPITIRAIPEGTVVEVQNVIATVQNNDSELPWLTSFVETTLLSYVWYGTTVASLSWAIKQNLLYFLEKNGTPENVEFKLHDFGMRGVAAGAAGLGGAAHLVNFRGTDTVAGITYLNSIYGDIKPGDFLSIPASEHSTATSWKDEIAGYRNMIEQYAKPGAIFACVIDSYDVWTALDYWITDLLPLVKKAGATVVLRPDSGDPIKTPVSIIENLLDRVGSTVNSKGYRVLPDHVRVIQGDGINHESIYQILTELDNRKISADNIAFGMGGGLLQNVNRDTFGFAMKTSAVYDPDGSIRGVCKTAEGKSSRKGRFAVIGNPKAGFETATIECVRPLQNQLVIQYSGFPPDWRESFAKVRERAIDG